MSGVEITPVIARIAAYMREQRDRFFAAGKPLEASHAAPMKRFFSDALLARVRIAEKSGRKIPEPPFYAEAREFGIQNLPSLNHMASLTFVDALVFPGSAAPRDLFHALVHAAQFEALGSRFTWNCTSAPIFTFTVISWCRSRPTPLRWTHVLRRIRRAASRSKKMCGGGFAAEGTPRCRSRIYPRSIRQD